MRRPVRGVPGHAQARRPRRGNPRASTRARQRSPRRASSRRPSAGCYAGRYARRVQVQARRTWIIVLSVGLAAVLAVGAAKAAARVTDDPVVWGLAGWVVPGDFGVFLVAGEAVLDGKSPYPE